MATLQQCEEPPIDGINDQAPGIDSSASVAINEAPASSKRCGTCHKFKSLEDFEGKATCNVCLSRKRKRMSEMKAECEGVVQAIKEVHVALAQEKRRNAELKDEYCARSWTSDPIAFAVRAAVLQQSKEFGIPASQTIFSNTATNSGHSSHNSHSSCDSSTAISTPGAGSSGSRGRRTCTSCHKQKTLDFFRGANVTCEPCLKRKKLKAEEAKQTEEQLRRKLIRLQQDLAQVQADNHALVECNQLLWIHSLGDVSVLEDQAEDVAAYAQDVTAYQSARDVGAHAGDFASSVEGFGSGASSGCMTTTMALNLTMVWVLLLILLSSARLTLTALATLVQLANTITCILGTAQVIGALGLGFLFTKTWADLKVLHLCCKTADKKAILCFLLVDIALSILDVVVTILACLTGEPHDPKATIPCITLRTLRIIRVVVCVATVVVCMITLQHITALKRQVVSVAPAVQGDIESNEWNVPDGKSLDGDTVSKSADISLVPPVDQLIITVKKAIFPQPGSPQ
jgi:hypothetical protein